MNTKHGTVAHVRVIGRCALTGVLAAMLATQGFAQGATDNQPTPNAPAASLAADNGNAAQPVAAVLPDAPAAVASSSGEPASAVMMTDASSSAVTSTAPKKHHVKPGWLVLGVAGGLSAGLGAYIFSIKTTQTGRRDALGTMFLAPGAAAAGLGFYFAFK